MISAEEIVGEKWAAWYRLTPLERWHKSGEILQEYLAAGGSLDPEFDAYSPFNDIYYADGAPTRVGSGCSQKK